MATSLVTVEPPLALLELNRPPANADILDLLTDLGAAVEEVCGGPPRRPATSLAAPLTARKG